MGKIVRIQFEVGDQQLREIENLLETTGFRTKKDLMNNALSLFAWAVGEKKAGLKIASIDEQNRIFREVIIPGLLK